MFMSANPKSAIILSHLWRINVNFRTYVDNHSAMYNIIAGLHADEKIRMMFLLSQTSFRLYVFATRIDFRYFLHC